MTLQAGVQRLQFQEATGQSKHQYGRSLLLFLNASERHSCQDPLYCTMMSSVELGSSSYEGPNLPLSPDPARALGMVLQLSMQCGSLLIIPLLLLGSRFKAASHWRTFLKFKTGLLKETTNFFLFSFFCIKHSKTTIVKDSF